ncbi:hypothetical protein SKAU_G00023450 [Synaphobranchus kaupii]|uniref:Uncharacterized protein n=1 Tax=Synaphobranchus kaupii TaxID=118154 RepID=A0A9Q1JEN2_SYNKA|nr:hypothetical protein SKAU_G00023450 [Synaphobranchus kaupii]
MLLRFFRGGNEDEDHGSDGQAFPACRSFSHARGEFSPRLRIHVTCNISQSDWNGGVLFPIPASRSFPPTHEAFRPNGSRTAVRLTPITGRRRRPGGLGGGRGALKPRRSAAPRPSRVSVATAKPEVTRHARPADPSPGSPPPSPINQRFEELSRLQEPSLSGLRKRSSPTTWRVIRQMARPVPNERGP